MNKDKKYAIIEFSTPEVVRGSYGYDSYVLFSAMKEMGYDVDIYEDITPFRVHRLTKHYDHFIIHFWSYQQIETIKWANWYLQGDKTYIGYRPLIKKHNLPENELWMNEKDPEGSNKVLRLGMKYMHKIFPIVEFGLLSDSVSYNTQILVKDKNDNINSTKIGDFVNNIINNTNENRQTVEVKNLKYKILTLNKENKIIWEKLTHIYRHKTDKKMFMINTSQGYVEVTEDHSVYKLDNNYNLQQVSPKELKINDIIVAIKNYDFNFNKEYSLKDFGKEISMHPNAQKIDLNIKIDEDIMGFLGLFVGDGSYGADGVYISHGNDDDLNNFCKKIANKLNISYFVKSKFDCALHSRNFVKILINMGFNTGSFEKNIPGWIFTLNKKLRGAFLRGYLSADGCVNTERHKHGDIKKIGYQTVSEKLGQDLITLILSLGYHLNINYLEQKEYTFGKEIKKRQFLDGKIRKITKGTITNYDDMIRFKDEIGFLTNEKNKLMIDIKPRIFSTYYQNRVPVIGILKMYFPGRQFIERNKLKDIKELQHIYNSDINFVLIKDIKKMKNYDNFVYDLTVPKTGNFIGDNFVCKNCDLHVADTDKRKMYPLFTSYGCPHQCEFCPIPPNRANFALKRVPLELDDLEYSINGTFDNNINIHFLDEDMFINPEWIHSLLDMLIKRQEYYKQKGWKPFKWIGLGSVDTIYRYLIKYGKEKLIKSGCFILEVGLETQDAILRKHMNKTGNIEQVNYIIKNLKEIKKFWLAVTFFPGETITTLNDMGKWLKKYGNKPFEIGQRINNNGHEAGLGQFFQPYDGTKMFNNMNKLGITIEQFPIRLLPSFLPFSYLKCKPKQIKSITKKDKRWFGIYQLDLDKYSKLVFDGSHSIKYFWNKYNDSKLIIYIALMARLNYIIEA